jgi:SAM-dependent methyltransferase
MAATASGVRDYYRQILPFFDLELADRGDGAFWTWAAGTPHSCRVLELGAGTGRATAFLARSAGSVTALDIDLDLLAVASQRLAGCGNVRLLASDMRCAGLEAEFDLVAAVDDPFVHLTRDRDRDRALRTVASLLRPGGRFVLDAAWLSPTARRRAARPEGLVQERAHGRRGELLVRESWRCGGEDRRCRVRFDYRLDGEPVGGASFRGRLWSLTEVQRRCRAASLEPVALWGDYDRRPWDRATSPRMIAAARRLG